MLYSMIEGTAHADSLFGWTAPCFLSSIVHSSSSLFWGALCSETPQDFPVLYCILIFILQTPSNGQQHNLQPVSDILNFFLLKIIVR